jgi:hypothetical protein
MDIDSIFDLIRFGLVSKPEPRYYKCVPKDFWYPAGVRCGRTIKVDGAIEVPAAVKNDGEWLESAFKMQVEIKLPEHK